MKLPEAVAAYVAYKLSLGMRFATEARTLKSFYRTLGDIDMRDVDADRVHAFLDGNRPWVVPELTTPRQGFFGGGRQSQASFRSPKKFQLSVRSRASPATQSASQLHAA
ncbi:hypothetical protein B0G69_6436 [Paraburkholderia sp. RAU2J]|uniref:hypothetical protein n=1 Tax=Paraburkholderia sp. RAU2J TaxID=1938810 RepID=UPI000F12EFE7|nr:hypothetical protein [Paraburkholderia sp. RAU2J]RKT13307.1 hypothetical protein B0G69_6436 [Paraburkholderia sp. RAU2J]